MFVRVYHEGAEAPSRSVGPFRDEAAAQKQKEHLEQQIKDRCWGGMYVAIEPAKPGETEGS